MQLVYFRDPQARYALEKEFVILDSGDMTEAELSAEYLVKPFEIIPLDEPLNGWPTDRALTPE